MVKLTKISRSFTKTVQVTQFHPIVASCELTAEVDVDKDDLEEVSHRLDKSCKREVAKSIEDELETPTKREVSTPKVVAKKTSDTGDINITKGCNAGIINAGVITSTATDFKTRPEILTQANIPKPLHGLNPRTIKGQQWWDKTRQEAYASTDYKCLACGIPKELARRKQLHAHESYTIDYKKKVSVIDEIIPVCPMCHDFIHSGRLEAMFDQGVYSRTYCRMVLEKGINILAENDLPIYEGTSDFAVKLNFLHPLKITRAEEVEWKGWRLQLEGVYYSSKFNTEKKWKDFYEKKEVKKEDSKKIIKL